jgi:RNA polymerase sigma factor (sigma-70 family)
VEAIGIEKRWGVQEVAGRIDLEDLYLSEGAGASKLALLLTHDPEAARDVVQEAFARIARRLFILRSSEHARAYLYRTVINLCHARGRQLKRERALQERIEAPGVYVGDPFEQDEMWRAMKRLPERQRAALFFRYYLDESEAMAAEGMGCSVSAMKSLVHRALAALREETEEPRG